MKGFRLLRPEDKNVAGYMGNLAEDTAPPIPKRPMKIIKREYEEPAISLIDDAADVIKENLGSDPAAAVTEAVTSTASAAKEVIKDSAAAAKEIVKDAAVAAKEAVKKNLGASRAEL